MLADSRLKSGFGSEVMNTVALTMNSGSASRSSSSSAGSIEQNSSLNPTTPLSAEGFTTTARRAKLRAGNVKLQASCVFTGRERSNDIYLLLIPRTLSG